MQINPCRLQERHLSSLVNQSSRRLVVIALWLLAQSQAVHAMPPNPAPPPPWLDYWTFDDTNNWTSLYGYPPASFTNVTTSQLGDYWTANLDATNTPAWLNYNITEADGKTHFRVDRGTVMFWFAPNWIGTNEGGTGPGEWSRLLEVGT